MLFRSDFWRFNKESINERDHRWISRIAAVCWNNLPEPRRVPYQDRARKLKDEHAQLYPQHKYNLSAKDKARKKVKEIDDDELCDVLAAQVVQEVRASKSPRIPGSSEGGLLDQVMEQKVNLKRSRSASAVAGASRGDSQPSTPPVKKRKRNLRGRPPTNVPPVSGTQSQTGPFHSSIPPFVPTNEIPVLTLPPTIKRESPEDLIPELAVHIIPVVSSDIVALRIP
jgi:hypothetical protein